jgi:long-chain acyl-CoA synthetase
MEPTRLFDILPLNIEKYGAVTPCYCYKRNGQWETMTLDHYSRQTDLLSSALLHLGIQKDDKVALIAGNRPEWNIIDRAIQQVGAVDVAIYPTISASEYEYILRHAEVKAVFIENVHLLNKVGPIAQKVGISHIFTIESTNDTHTNYATLLSMGEQHYDSVFLDEVRARISTDDVCTLIYTSGTTGNPKGVMLTHRNFIDQILHLKHIIDPVRDRRALSFLPLCHVYERMLVYLYLYMNITTYYAQSLGTIVDDIKIANPQIMSCVPRVLERIYIRLRDKGKSLSGLTKTLYYWSIGVANAYDIEHRTLWYRIKHSIADRLIFSKWRNAIGGDFDIVVSGGSGIAPELCNFFEAIGWPVFQGYGMSETSPVIAVSNRRPHGRKSGTVGPALDGVEIRIDPKNNEICCRGHNIMKGYYKAPELTAEMFDDDGWFHTGDAGRFDEHKRLIITGRIKSLFKTSLGKYINPEIIEDKLQNSPLIDNIMVVGENQRFPAAIVVPNIENLRALAEKNGISCDTDEEMIRDKAIEKLLMNNIRKFDKYFGDWEQIKRIRLVNDEWSTATGVVTPTLKLKRGILMRQYENEIAQLFV